MIEPEPDLRLLRALFAELLDECGDLLKLAGRWLRPHHHHRHKPPAPTNFHGTLITYPTRGPRMPSITYSWDTVPAPANPPDAVTAAVLSYGINGGPDVTVSIDPNTTTFTAPEPLSANDVVRGRLHFTNGNGDGPEVTTENTVTGGGGGGLPPAPTGFKGTINP